MSKKASRILSVVVVAAMVAVALIANSNYLYNVCLLYTSPSPRDA